MTEAKFQKIDNLWKAYLELRRVILSKDAVKNKVMLAYPKKYQYALQLDRDLTTAKQPWYEIPRHREEVLKHIVQCAQDEKRNIIDFEEDLRKLKTLFHEIAMELQHLN